MQNLSSFLVDWMVRFLENKDSIRKLIVKVEKDKKDSGFVVNYKDKVKHFSVKTVLENEVLDKINGKSYWGIVTLNSTANIRFVIDNWKKLSGFEFLSIYFVNPFSKSDKMWILQPYVHDKICDKSSLELGLRTMSGMVEEMNDIKFEQRLKSKKEASDL